MLQKSYLSQILNNVRDGGELQDIDIQPNYIVAIIVVAILLGSFWIGYLIFENAGHTVLQNPKAKDVNDGAELMFWSALGFILFVPMLYRMKFRIFQDGFSIRYLTKGTLYSWADIVGPIEVGKLRGKFPAVVYYASQPAKKWYSLKYKNGNYISGLFTRNPATIAEIMNIYRNRSLKGSR